MFLFAFNINVIFRYTHLTNSYGFILAIVLIRMFLKKGLAACLIG